jgi:hypothetical protein
MANLLIGSSNLARFYKPELFKEFRPYQMMKCTTMDSFSALMTELEEGRNNVIISVFENIITDAAKPAKDDDTVNKLIGEAIKTSVSLIGKTAARLPESKFCIVMPLMRPAHKWFQEKQTLIDETIREAIAGCVTKKHYEGQLCLSQPSTIRQGWYSSHPGCRHNLYRGYP